MERERTPYEIIYFAVYLVFKGLSFRACSRGIQPLIKRTHKAVWDWYQEIGSDTSFHKLFRFGREHVKIFAVDETGMQAFLFIAYEQFEDRILVSIGFDTSEMGGSMAEVLAYGTALVVEPDSAPPQPVSLHCDVSLFSIKCEKYSSHFRKVSTTN